MVKLIWRIVEDIKELEVNDPILGGVEFQVNDNVVGYCPQRELFPGEELYEMVSYAVETLGEAAVYMSRKQKYEILLLSSNLLQLHFNPGELIEIECFHIGRGEAEWIEKVEYDEFYREIHHNLKDFLAYIKLHNRKLLKSAAIRNIGLYEKELSKILLKKK